jgi:small basic protein
VFLIPLLALVFGVLLGIMLGVPVGGVFGLYIAVGVIAGLDSVFGGWRSALEGKFQNDVFITGFFSNVLVASLLAFVGDNLGIDLYLAAVLVMGWRMFTNLSIIRRHALNRWQDARARSRTDRAQGD